MESNKKVIVVAVITFIVGFVLGVISSSFIPSLSDIASGGNKLNEESAKISANSLLAQGSKLPDYPRRGNISLIEWHGLTQVSETEFHGKSKISYGGRELNGAFIFHKNVNGGWILDKVSFRSSGGGTWWNQDVFQKVE